MDIKTGLSIYNKQWLVEPTAALQMLDYWERVKAGELNWNYRAIKSEEGTEELSPYRIYQQLFEKDSIVMAPESSWDMPAFKGFEGATVAIIPVSGPLMKADFCGYFGTNTLRQLSIMASKTDSIQTILYLIDSPGGTVDGTQAFADAIRSSDKRTIALVDGMMCSAAYWIGSAAKEVYATSSTDIIGSIGTMCTFYDNSKAMEARGIVLREYYATASKDKNRATKEALEGDGKKLVQEMLDPMNNVFLSAVRESRGDKIAHSEEQVLTGKTFTSERATSLGLIDGIKTIEEAMVYAINGSASKNKTTTTTQTNKYKIMTSQEFKAQHRAEYDAMVKDIVTAERDRVGAWMAFMEIDAEAAKKGIAEGNEVTQKTISEMTVKAMSKAKLGAMETESAEAVQTAEVPAEAATGDKKAEVWEKELDKALGLK